MYISTTTLTLLLALLTFTPLSTAAPKKEHVIEERHIILEERQADVSQLLQLASLAGITALPNDPTLLLSLGPLAATLAAALPTPSVLSVLETAAPSDFVSDIINNPSYASSFEAAFSAGSSPSWFNALPTDVRSYLHTYEGFGVLAGAAGGVKSVESATATAGGSSGSGTGAAATGSASGGSASGSSGAGRSGSGASGSGASVTAGSSAASGGAGGASSSATAAGGGASSASSHGGAAAPTGAFAAGVVGVVGMLGAVALL